MVVGSGTISLREKEFWRTIATRKSFSKNEGERDKEEETVKRCQVGMQPIERHVVRCHCVDWQQGVVVG